MIFDVTNTQNISVNPQEFQNWNIQILIKYFVSNYPSLKNRKCKKELLMIILNMTK